jgi:hypothetical protein
LLPPARSISARNSVSRVATQLVVSPTWTATSRLESPQLIGQAMCTVVHAACGESRSQAVELGIVGVEWDEFDPAVESVVADTIRWRAKKSRSASGRSMARPGTFTTSGQLDRS